MVGDLGEIPAGRKVHVGKLSVRGEAAGIGVGLGAEWVKAGECDVGW